MTIREHIPQITSIPLVDMLDWCTFGELELDSLDVKDLCYQLESRLNFRASDESWERCRSIGDIVRVAQKSLEDSACSVS